MHPYEKIRTEMLRRISNHTWPSGAAIPHEEELALEFGVARGTVRRAMALLVDQGLLEKRRKAGTRVAVQRAHSSTLSIPIVRKEIMSRGAAYDYRLISKARCVTPPHALEFFGSAKIVRVCCLHLCDEQPYQLEERLISLNAVPEAATEAFDEISPNEWLIERVPYSAVRTRLKAEAADMDQSTHLAIATGDPVFTIFRETRLNAEPITHVKMSHRADTFEIVTETDVS